MGWEDRGGCGPYYYRSVREGDRVRKVYGGRGVMGTLAAQADEMRLRQREEEKAFWKDTQEDLVRRTGFIRELEEATNILVQAHLIVNGFRKIRGEWRRARG